MRGLKLYSDTDTEDVIRQCPKTGDLLDNKYILRSEVDYRKIIVMLCEF